MAEMQTIELTDITNNPKKETMKPIVTSHNHHFDLEDLVHLMDNDLREEVHSDTAPCEPQQFYDAHTSAHFKKFNNCWEPNNHNPQI